MDRFNELFEYTARNPLTPILDVFREKVDTNDKQKIGLLDLFYDVSKYCREFRENEAISTLEDQLFEILPKIKHNQVSISYFDPLINSAKGFTSDR